MSLVETPGPQELKKKKKKKKNRINLLALEKPAVS